MLSFRTAALVTGALFVALPAAVLLLTGTWVEQYVSDPAHWPIVVDNFRFIAALNLTVGALLLAVATARVDAAAQLRLALATGVGVGLLAAVHFVVLGTNASPAPRWNATLYADTAFFSLVALYWLGVSVRLRRPAARAGA